MLVLSTRSPHGTKCTSNKYNIRKNNGNFKFPDSPNTGDQYTGDNGVVYTFDGVKWTGATSGGGGSADTGNIIFNGNRISTSSNQVEIYVDNDEDGYFGQVYVDRNETSLWAENDVDGDNPAYAGIITSITSGLDNPKVEIAVNPQSSDPNNPQKWTFDSTGGLTFPERHNTNYRIHWTKWRKWFI